MLTCLYHPTEKTRVLEDDSEKFKDLLASGFWFRHPNDAKALRAKYEREIQDEKKRDGLHSKSGKGSSNRKKPS